MKKPLLLFFFCFPILAQAQTIIEPDTIYSDAGDFSTLSFPTLLGLDVTDATTSSTTFPYSPTVGFEPEIGYVSEFGIQTGTITHIFATPQSIAQVWIWNAYFDFELDHCVQDVTLTLRDELGADLYTEDLVFSESTPENLEPEILDLAEEVTGVSEVAFTVNSLHGGNEISIRRLAYASNFLSSNNEVQSLVNQVIIYPNPATDHILIPLQNIEQVIMFDVLGRQVSISASNVGDQVQVSWNDLAAGMYYLHIYAEGGQFSAPVQVIGR